MPRRSGFALLASLLDGRLYYSGPTLRGEYRDQLDRSLSVGGTFTPPTFALVVDFGDAKLNLTRTTLSR